MGVWADWEERPRATAATISYPDVAMPDDPNLPLTAKQVAALLRCHPLTVRRMIRDGILPATMVSGRFYISRSAFEAWWSQQTGSREPMRGGAS